MGLFTPPRGFASGSPRTYDEMQLWALAGLIPTFSDDTSTDKVVADILKVVREHLESNKPASH